MCGRRGDFTKNPDKPFVSPSWLSLTARKRGTAMLVARASDRRADQKLLSWTLLHERFCSLVPLQRGSGDDEIPSDDPRQRQTFPSVPAASGRLRYSSRDNLVSR